MSVRLNLLPDLRQQRLKDKQRRQSALVIAVIVWSVAGGVTLLFALYNGTQSYAINQTTKKINDKKAQLQDINGLTDALTAQQHLASLAALYGKRTYLSKFFDAYSSLAPGSVALNALKINNTNILTISGSSDTYTNVTKLAAAMAAENVTIGANAKAANQPYFTAVSIDDVSRTDAGSPVTFSLTATISPEVVANGK
ncbi:PilN domain-containing protein [Candidatus Saccharibacteria bacterium]|nr:PilN domain-containing protein [Candidatus Saccharibacteria bacterium]